MHNYLLTGIISDMQVLTLSIFSYPTIANNSKVSKAFKINENVGLNNLKLRKPIKKNNRSYQNLTSHSLGAKIDIIFNVILRINKCNCHLLCVQDAAKVVKKKAIRIFINLSISLMPHTPRDIPL